MASDRKTIDGYVADSLYPSAFHATFSAPWTDAVLRHRSIATPRRAREPFAFVDLGCGDGVGLVISAVAHPEARFIGIDASQAHIDRGQRLIDELGVSNIVLSCATFQQALAELEACQADYLIAQGVMAWVSADNRAALIELAAHLLRPGGALTIGYNCNPGWLRIAPLQRLLAALGTAADGAPADRFDAAWAAVRQSGAIEADVITWIDDKIGTLPRDYMAHEYLNQHWQPLWAADVLRQLRGHGFQFVGDARAWRLRDDFALKAKWRTLLAAIDDQASRQSALDVITQNWFRTDVFVKAPAVADDQQTAERLAGFWASTTAAADASYQATTQAGTIRFDNAAARAIMAQLENGPGRLSAVTGIGAADVLNAADALFVADLIVPVDPPAAVPFARQANALARASKTPDFSVNALVGSHGALQIRRDRNDAIDAKFCARMGIDPTWEN